MRKRTDEESVKVDATPFELKLPDLFNIQPNHVVQLPRGCTAEIYNIKMDKEIYDYNAGKRIKLELYDGWRVIIRGKSGHRLGLHRSVGFETDVECSKLLTVKHVIESAVRQLTKVRVTRTNRSVDENAIDDDIEG